MHDLKTIQRMNDEEVDKTFKYGDRVRVVLSSYFEGETGYVGEVAPGEALPIYVVLDNESGGVWYSSSELAREFPKTPESIAQDVLDNHAIRDHFRRDGEQIRDLLIEAVNLARKTG